MKKRLINVLSVVFLLIALGTGGYLLYYYGTGWLTEREFEELRGLIVETEEQKQAFESDDDDTGTVTGEGNKKNEDATEEPAIDYVVIHGNKVQRKFEKLYSENRDFIGWLKIEDTLVDYPVMHTPTDSEKGEYYIRRAFDENYSAAGLPFIDKNCLIETPTDNIIIYGHNMKNGTMFHDIIKYASEEFYQRHKTFTFDTIYGDGTYEVVAAFYGQIFPSESDVFQYYNFVNAGDEEEFMNFVNNIKEMSVIDTGVEVRYGDKLVTLSTCAYHVENGRFAVIAKKVK